MGRIKTDGGQESNFAFRYRLGIFFLLTIPLGWIFWIQIFLGLWPLELVLIPSTLGAVSPLISLKIIEKATHKQVSFDGILSSVRTWKSSIPYLILAAFAYPLLAIAANGINFMLGLETEFFILDPVMYAELGFVLLAVIPIHFSASLITSPLFEEPAWRGFAMTELQQRYGREIGSFIIGSYWWLWHQMMNISFGLEPSVLGYLSMVGQSFMIDSLFNLSKRNILTAMFAHQALGTTFTFIYNSSRHWTLMIFIWGLVIILRVLESRRGQISSNPSKEPFVLEESSIVNNR
ncbi:MAG: CPBP family intramembrane metalloprotease [Candidatus Thorarchaeota archaeon]|nr:CPBP family intramembrane metalloprotease [Candidatus Thorarchaeota archaeon]